MFFDSLKKYFLYCIVYYSINNTCYSQHDSIFDKLAFGKGSVVYHIGSGALKRHLDLNKIKSEIKEYSKTPALVFGIDICFHPYASNAYLGIGPYISNWIGVKEVHDNNNVIESTFSNTTLGLKLSHHVSYFVRKKLDVCTGYVAGINLKYYHNYMVNGVNSTPNYKNPEIVPAFGVTLSVRHYIYRNIGYYLEAGLGYRINMLNIGICLKTKSLNK